MDEVLVRLEGDGLAPIERTIGRPISGSTYHVDFEVEPAVVVPVFVRGPDGTPVSGAVIQARWYRDTRFVEIERSTGTDGIAYVPVLSGSATYYSARTAAGFAPPLGPITFMTAPSEPVLIELARAGRISGRCVRDGQPLRDFEVAYWTNRPADRQLLRVVDAVDGKFVVEDAPIGEVMLCAHSSDWPVGETKAVTLVENGEATVELSVGDACEGRGIVVDAASGEPLTNASVRAITSLPDATSLFRGPIVRVDFDGSFSVRGLPIGEAKLWVTAPEHGEQVALAQSQRGTVTDFGVIPMARAQTLEITLESQSPFDFTLASAQSFNSPLLPLRRFDSTGKLSYEGVPPREVRLHVTVGDMLMELVDLDLVPGRPWRYVIPIDGGRVATIRTKARSSSTEPAFVQAVFRRGAETTSRYVKFDSNGEARVSGIVGEDLTAAVFDANWLLLGSRACSVPATGDFEVEVECELPRLRVRVVDEHDAPVTSATVTAGVESSLGWMYSHTVDGSGWCSLDPLDAPKIWVRAFAATKGVSAALTVDVDRTDEQAITIRLADLRSARIRLDDRGTPCVGVATRFVSANDFLIHEVWSDASGRAVSLPYGDERGVVVVDDIGYWPIRFELPYPRSEDEVVVPLRRLGGVRFEARAVDGAVVPGAVVELRSVEFGASLQDWIAEGKFTAPSSGFVTDASGVLIVDGLPNGDYEWRATAPDGSQASGIANVPPRARGTRAIVF
ncbi:MAG: carboxypeptidase-like regulatory domain-containing protein [Planctomycetes bacterium]|nr:carboxypeptidase-like regulatory domain-containing protein [Planctomycetota bacterium]